MNALIRFPLLLVGGMTVFQTCSGWMRTLQKRCAVSSIRQLCNARQCTAACSARWMTCDAEFSTNQNKSQNDDSSHNNKTETWTVDWVLKDAIQRLQKAGVDEAVESATHLLSDVLNLSWETGYRELQQQLDSASLIQQQQVTSQQLARFESLIQRRLQHEPIQYLLGQWDWLDYTLIIRPPLLCPRPETEELIQLVVDDITKVRSSSQDTVVRILDVGCGTGCIGIALADLVTNAQVTAIDVEPMAVETAQQNAAAILLDSNRYRVELCDAHDYNCQEPFDVVVSNPPYIPEADLATLDDTVRRYESHRALLGGPDGMNVIRTIVKQLQHWCHRGSICWMEVDPSHPTKLREWLSSHDGVDFVDSYRDLSGRERFVKLRVR